MTSTQEVEELKDVVRQLRTALITVGVERTALKEENAELTRLFELQRKRMNEATAVWQAAHPGNENTWPDLGVLLAWLLSQRKGTP